MAHIVLASRLAFQKVREDDPKIPVGDEEIVTKGNRVPSYVSLFTISALEAAGAIVPVADNAEVVVESVGPIEPIPTAPLPPADTPASFFPPSADVVEADEGLGPVAPAGALPKASDKREVWEAYAITVGMTADEAAEFPNKTDLIAAVDERLRSK